MEATVCFFILQPYYCCLIAWKHFVLQLTDAKVFDKHCLLVKSTVNNISEIIRSQCLWCGNNLVPRAISAFKLAGGREEDPGEEQVTCLQM